MGVDGCGMALKAVETKIREVSKVIQDEINCERS